MTIVDIGSPVTFSTMTKFNNKTVINPITVDYRDVNDNQIHFQGKTTANIETKRNSP